LQALKVNLEYYPIISRKITPMYEAVTRAKILKNAIFKSYCDKFLTTYHTHITFHMTFTILGGKLGKPRHVWKDKSA
jgi:hypothetical protein